MPRPRSDNPSANALYMRRRRAEAHAKGETIPSETWWMSHRVAHRHNVRDWRAANKKLSDDIARNAQTRRRSTPWGRINNRLVTILHRGVRVNSARPSKYTAALGYLWSDLRAHIEALFLPGMTWANWGRRRGDWQLDHVVPLSTFHFVSLGDRRFRAAWALTNLEPLWRDDNVRKGKNAKRRS